MPTPMQDLITLFRHNTWANGKVFDLAAQQDPDLMLINPLSCPLVRGRRGAFYEIIVRLRTSPRAPLSAGP